MIYCNTVCSEGMLLYITSHLVDLYQFLDRLLVFISNTCIMSQAVNYKAVDYRVTV